MNTSAYYLPTPGETPGHWNVFPVHGPARLDVPFADLPLEVKNAILSRRPSTTASPERG